MKTDTDEYNRHMRNAAMYRREAERKLDRRFHPACAAGDLAYARWHEKAAEALKPTQDTETGRD